MVGLQPLGNHLVLWPQLAPGKTPTFRDPQEALALSSFQKHTAKSPRKLAALCFSLETSFHVLRQWNSLFAIQINITSLITLFIKSVCRKMRLQSRTSQDPQNSVPTATPDPNPSPMVNINREADGDEDLIKSSRSCNSRDGCKEEVILLTPFVFILPAVSR